MKRRKKNIKKIVLIILIFIIILIASIIVGKKVYEQQRINVYNEIKEAKINELFLLQDLNLNYDGIIEKYGRGTDNINSNDKLFCTNYISKFNEYEVIRSFYYDDLMNIEKIKIYNSDISKYELLQIITEYLGECIEYDNEIKQLASMYKWKYKEYEIILIDNVDSIIISIEKIN